MSDASMEPVALAGGTLGERRHACALFHTRGEEYRTFLPFVLEGFARGEKAIHIVDPALRANHLERLAAAGVDVVEAQARNQLEVHGWTETYRPGEPFDWRATATRVTALQRQARADGFPRLRMLAHADWVGNDPANLARFIEYESRMNDVLSAYDDVIICVYDRSRLGGDAAIDLVRAHAVSVLDGALYENPLFEPTSRFVARLRGDATAVLRDRFVAALVAGAGREALDVVVEEGLWGDVPVLSLYLDVVQPALWEIGRLWEGGRITVVQEHVATEIARAALAQLRPHLPLEARNGRHVVVACVEAELHDLGARIAADFLEMAGFEVRFLGANVPTSGLVDLVRRRPPDLLALSASTTGTLAALRRAIVAVRGVAGDRVPVVVGGQVFARRPELPDQLGIPYGRDALDAVAVARRLLAK